MTELVMSPDGYTVSRNGVTMTKPANMSDDYWFKYEANRVGKTYGKHNFLYGMQYEQPKSGTEEMEDGCGGACSI